MNIPVGKGFIPKSGRGFYWSPNAATNPNATGLSTEDPFKTLQACIDAVNALVPQPPSGGNATISAVQDDLVFGQISLPPYTTCNFKGVGIAGATSDFLLDLAGNNQSVDITIVSQTGTGSAVRAQDVESMSFQAAAIGSNGNGSIGIEVAGSNKDVFFDIVQMRIDGGGNSAIGYKVSGVTQTPLDISTDQLDLEGDGDVGLCIDLDDIDQTVEATILTVVSPGNNTKGLFVKNGVLNYRALSIAATTVFDVEDSAHLAFESTTVNGDMIVRDGGGANARVGSMEGDITVELNGSLEIFILEYSGDISPSDPTDGRINGLINGVPYGSYRNPTRTFDFGRRSNLQQNAFMDSDNVAGDSDRGPVASENTIPESLSWSETRGRSGVFEIYTAGAKIAEAAKTADLVGVAPVVLDVADTFIAEGATISIRWVPDGTQSIRNVNVSLNTRKYPA